MKHTAPFTRILAFFTAALLALTSLPLTALADTGRLGEQLYSLSRPIAQSAVFSTQALQGDAEQTPAMVTYSPGGDIQPVAAYGSRLYGKSTISAIADFVAESGRTVVAAINGDFFSSSTGLPLGMVVTDGVLRSSDAGRNAVGFTEEGYAVIGAPELSMTLTGEGFTVPVSHLNKLRTAAGGIYLLTGDFSAETRHTGQGRDVILQVVEGQPSIGGSMTLLVEDVIDTDISMAIPENTYVLTASIDSAAYELLLPLSPGMELTLTIEAADPAWNEVTQAVGGGDLLLDDGELCTEFDSAIASGNPRTAVGVKDNGDVVFYTLDGRRSGYSVGASLQALAEELQALGCIDAINLDGGGSTALMVRTPGDQWPSLVTRPSDGSLRSVANALLLCSTTPATGQAQMLHPVPYGAVALANSSILVSATATDEGYHAAPAPSDITLSLLDETASQDSLLRLPDTAGEYVLEATSGSLSGSAPITVIQTPDTLSVAREDGDTLTALMLSEGEVVPLSVTATWARQEVLLSADSLHFEVRGAAATVDEQGVLTASTSSGTTGTLLVTAGELTVSIPLATGNAPYSVEDFETQGEPWSAQATVTRTTVRNEVRYGLAALRIDYDLAALPEGDPQQTAPEGQEAETGETEPPTSFLVTPASPYTLADSPTALRLWLSGDAASLTLHTNAGDAVVDFAGSEAYEAQVVLLPEGASSLSGITVTPAQPAGRLLIDQITAGFDQNAPDTASPVITGMLLEPQLDEQETPTGLMLFSATASTAAGAPVEQVMLTLDGTSLPLSYDADTMAVTATLEMPADGEHRLTLTALDANGNLARSTLLQSGEQQALAFADTEGHWAQDNIAYVFARGLFSGETEDDGLTYFRPDRSLSRAEIAAVLVRLLGENVEDYAQVSLPFEDADSLPEWALPYIRAVYALGLVNGRATETGAVYAANEPITRAELVTILEKTLPKGYAAGELTFSDADTIPDWAAEAVAVLTNLGILGGYEDGSFQPNGAIKRSEAAKVLSGLY